VTHEVGKKAPNGLGIYDMSGNVEEWCWDWYGSYSSEAETNPVGAAAGASRVLRGGGYNSHVYYTRSASRSKSNPVGRDFNFGFGFRVVRP